MDLIYLDSNATTKPAPEVVEAMLPYLTELYGNPSSVHRFGQRVRRAVDEARAKVAALVNAAEGEISFTGGGTEAINTALRGLLATRAPRSTIITTPIEHSASRELCARLGRDGIKTIEVPIDQGGELDLDFLRAALDDSVALVNIMWANNETGVIFPVEQISKLCREHKIPFHCDATQAVGKIPVDVTLADLTTFASHKFHGPKGVGALHIRRGLRVPALILGGPQERNRRGGTENVPGIVGMGVAAELCMQCLPKMYQVGALRDELETRILSEIDDTHVNGRADLRVPNTTNIGFARLEAEAILLLLSEQGVCASAGAACSSGSLEPSHVIKAMHIDERIGHGAIRFSLSRYTTREEINRAMEILPGVINRLRAVLPVSA